ncbi:MAG: septum formation family protein [Propioniciclava sp.]
MERILTSLALATGSAVLLSGCSSLIEAATEGSSEGVEDAMPSIDVGQCTDLDTPRTDEGTEVDDIATVDCAGPHKWEAYAETTLEGDTYPGEEEAWQQADSFCREQFTPFVGISYEESSFDLISLYPIEHSWNLAGDRLVTCLVGSDAGDLTGSLKGVNA